MILKDWLAKEGIKVHTFAVAVGLSPASLYRSIACTHKVGSKMALKIEAVTCGAVSRTEALYPEDFVDRDKNGDEQMRLTPKIHTELAKGIRIPKHIPDSIISDKEFYSWAYGIAEAQSPINHCVRWADKHPDLKRVDLMTMEDGIEYMRSEYQKYIEAESK
jgi:hypothetical protein